jgi:glycosyltransferase involved in cell wall biosynthesis
VPSRPLVSVVIPHRDDAERLRRCLEALRSQTLSEPFEVLVVDDGSSHPPSQVVDAHPHTRLLSSDGAGPYAARNIGVSQALGEILAFTDSDCIPAADWLEHGSRALRAAGRRAFTGGRIEVFPRDGRKPTAVEAFELIEAFPQAHYVRNGAYAVTANLLTPADVFTEVGPFRETLFSSGDREWGERAASKGIRAVYAPDALVRHPARYSVADLRQKIRRVEMGLAQLREERHQRLTVRDALWSMRPPLRSIPRGLRELPRSGLRSAAAYIGVAFLARYLHAYERLRRALDRTDRLRRPIEPA